MSPLPSREDQPLEGRRLGPFRLVRRLGSGGMGTVYLACSEEERGEISVGDRVAVKVLHPWLFENRDALRRFQRETEAGQRIRHRNVVSTLLGDEVEVGGASVHFIAMEFVEGRTLSAFLDDLGTVPEALLREIAEQVADGLAAIHESGVVHRDVKPGNLLITPEHRVRVMDLGVARLLEDSFDLTAEGQFLGSLPYAAPEQLGRGRVGTRTDLYGLGVVLYELATGENPFRGESPAAVIAAHLNASPPPLCESDERISAFFSGLVGALLAKDPDERPESAMALLQVLRQGELSTWWSDRARDRGGQPTIPVSREWTFVGREEELARLGDAWASARAGRGGGLVVVGEAGIGKTRLLHEFLRAIDTADANVLYGAHLPFGGRDGLLSSVLDHLGPDRLEDALARYLSTTPGLVPHLAAVVRGDRADALTDDALHAAFCHLVRGLAAEGPILWIVEDLHVAGAEGPRLLASIARAVEDLPVLLLATTEAPDRAGELLRSPRDGGSRPLVVERLDAEELRRLVGEVLANPGLAERLGPMLGVKSDGIPFFLLEILRALVQAGHLVEREDGSYEETEYIDGIEIPSTLRDLVRERLVGLSDDDRDLLNVAAVLGFHFDPDLVARVRGISRMSVLERLTAIERRSRIVRGRGAGFQFDHHQLREILYDSLHPQLLRDYHTAVAEAFAEREGISGVRDEVPVGETAVFLAGHLLRGSRPADARPHVAPALLALESEHRHEVARELAELALQTSVAVGDSERAALLLRTAGYLDLTGRRTEERKALDEAGALAERCGDLALQGRIHRAIGQHFWSLGEYEEALRTYDLYLRNAQARGDRREEGAATGSIGSVLLSVGRHEEALESIRRQLDIATATDDRPGQAWATGNLGTACHALGRYGLALEHFEENLRISRELGHRRGEGIGLLNVGSVCANLGDPIRAQACLEEAAALLRELGARRPEGYARHGLGEVAEMRGETREALSRYGDALNLRRQISYPKGTAESRLALARLLSGSDPAAARDHLEEALEIGRRTGLAGVTTIALCRTGLLEGSNVDEARELFELRSGELEPAEAMEVRFLLWRATEDRSHLDEAWRILETLRDHAPPEYRVTILEAVPRNREILLARGA